MTKEEVIKLTVEAVRQYDAKQKKSRHNRRLYNTRQLMKNYNALMEHCAKSIGSSEDLRAAENALDILDSVDELDRDLYIESIKRSNLRTQIILRHIEAMLRILKIYCDETDGARRYRIMIAYYVDGEPIMDIANKENVDKRTAYRDINFALEKLSALIFGVDGLAVMS